jgi:hypothetical protein
VIQSYLVVICLDCVIQFQLDSENESNSHIQDREPTVVVPCFEIIVQLSVWIVLLYLYLTVMLCSFHTYRTVLITFVNVPAASCS